MKLIKATELNAGHKIIKCGKVFEVVNVQKYPYEVYVRVKEDIDGNIIEYNIHMSPLKFCKIAD